MNFTLRQAKVSSDLYRMQIVSLHTRLFGGDLFVPDEPEMKTWVATVTGSSMVAGFLMAYPSTHYLDTIYLCRIAVHPDYQGKGLAKRLLRAAQSQYKRLSYKAMVTDTSMDNIGSMTALVSSGWKPLEPHTPWALDHSVYWYRQL